MSDDQGREHRRSTMPTRAVGAASGGSDDGENLVRGRNVVAVIDFHRASILPTDAYHGQRPEHIVPTDPHGHFHKVHHRAGDPAGRYEADRAEYWREITHALEPAGAILLLGHGKGKANATHQWVAYAEKHRRDVAAKVLADVRVDIDHLDDDQILRLAQHYFTDPPLRDLPDGRRAEPEGPARTRFTG